MTSQYPGALDDFSESSPTYMSDPDATGRDHSARHDDVESAIEQVQGTLGVNPQGSNATVAEKLAAFTVNAGLVGLGGAIPAVPLDVIADTAANGIRLRGRASDGYTGIQITDNPVTRQVGKLDFHPDGSMNWQGQRVPTHYWDESVGRRLFVYDTVNARWQMVYGDTGVRNVKTGLNNGWAVGDAWIRRVNSTVEFGVYGLDPAAATGNDLYTLPAGFRHNNLGNVYGLMTDANNLGSSVILPLLVHYGGWVGANRLLAAGGQGVVTWFTEEPWPASLPGTASGAIPTLLPAPPVDDQGNPVPVPPSDIDPTIPTGLTPDDDTSDWTVTYPDGPTP